MRVAFFTDTFAPTHDGVARLTSTLARALGRKGLEVSVYTVRAPGLPACETLEEGVRVVRYRSVPAPSYPEYRIALFPYSPALSGRFRRSHDLVHIHTPGLVGLAGWWAARRHGLPAVTTFHTDLGGMLTAQAHGAAADRFFRGWAEFNRFLCRRSDLVTAPTPAAARLALGVPDGSPIPPVRVIGNAVETDRFRPGLSVPDWTVRMGSAGRPIVLFLGRLTYDKGAHRMLEAVESIPEDVALFAAVGGSGPRQEWIRERIAGSGRLRGRACFLGAVTEREKPALLSQSAIFVLPSTADTSSVALLEAMASGSACVVTERGGPGQIVVDGETGLLVDPEKPPAIARAIERLLLHPEERERLARNGRAWVLAHASIERVAEEYLEAYGVATRQGTGRPSVPAS